MEILAAPGYAMAGWLPAELQDAVKFTWAAGIAATSRGRDCAASLIRYLSSSAAAVVIEAKGMIPETSSGS